ncbi:hypothetical protein B0H19DRAFT_1171644 [Mycena capillaripes]|nr:hypothetical protein B0H19DRAFT_1171644 [Mycena capillaripes]
MFGRGCVKMSPNRVGIGSTISVVGLRKTLSVSMAATAHLSYIARYERNGSGSGRKVLRSG